VLGSYQVATNIDAGTQLDTRVRLAVLETVGTDGVYLQCGSTTTAVKSGQPGMPTWTDWLGTDAGTSLIAVKFNSDATGHTDGGVVAEAFEYRRYQVGASPFFTPLRFPGQYHDAETDLFENWNRYYDPFTGRYLQPDPALASPRGIAFGARRAVSPIVYGYAGDDPLRFVDPNGLKIWGGAQFNPGLDCDLDGKAGNTCGRAVYGEPTPCSCSPDTSTCGDDNCGFDIDVPIDVGFSVDVSRMMDLDCNGRSVPQHEAEHVRIYLQYLSESALNSSIKTDGFSTIEECNTARDHILDSLHQRAADVDAVSNLMDALCAIK
jgi:RHS repeat-associated protein